MTAAQAGVSLASVRYSLPQPYRDIEHTADVGVEVEGTSPREALARLVLAQTSLLTGGAPVEVRREERCRAGPGSPASMAISILRELLFRFATERVLAAACEVVALDPEQGAEVIVALGPFDPDRHAEGLDLKAVTWHQALFEETGGSWRARVVFDI